MARKCKILLEDGVNKREVGYFPTPDFVSQYICEEMMLLNPNGIKVLDPAVGRGELVKLFLAYGKDVDGYDIIDYTHRPDEINFSNTDFVQDYISHKGQLIQRGYDYVVMNPPYLCHENSYIAANKKSLHTSFLTGTFNMFAMFLEAATEIAKDGCLIGCIVPDSLLFTPAYEKLRLKILSECEILQIVLCPTYLFRSKGAYVSTCILILRKGGTKTTSLIRFANRPCDISIFQRVLKKRDLNEARTDELILRITDKSTIFTIDCPNDIKVLFTTCPRLCELSMCGGGVSTGDNKQFTSVEKRDGFEVPYYPNVNARFLATPESFLCNDYMEQSRGTRKFIVRHPDKLECDGIVCSGIGKSFRAAYLPKEGVAGVNATIWPPKEDLFWLLAYLNSSLVSYLLKGIIARSHITTIGNVSSLPILNLTDSEKQSLHRISKQVINGKLAPEDAIAKIDRIVYCNINLSRGTRKMIRQFCADIIHLV